VPAGNELLLVLSVDPAEWPDTRKFPCSPSDLTDDPSSCDYVISGHPTDAGGSRSMAGDKWAPSCCPRGIVPFGPASAQEELDACRCAAAAGPSGLPAGTPQPALLPCICLLIGCIARLGLLLQPVG
jgi:hypothetical protein